jgi:hypothetical protein
MKYEDETTAELVLDLEAGAAVLTREGMHEFPAVMLACAQRLAEQEVIIKAAKSFDERQSNIAAAELRRALYEMYELQPWQQKVVEQIIPRDDRRDAVCVANWPECESGTYDPRCCRFPKSCSCGPS